MKDSAWDDKDSAYDIHMEDDEEGSVNGITEYGYGFWSKFLFNGPSKLLVKPDWMGMTRLTVNRDYTDASKPGDRTLAIWVGRGYYHFTTYTTGNNNVV